MPVKTDARKRENAETLGCALATLTDTLVEIHEVTAMTDYDLYDWLEGMGYEWDGEGWYPVERV